MSFIYNFSRKETLMERLEEIATRKAEIKSLLESDEQVELEEIKRELEALEVEEKAINEQIEAETKKAEAEAEERKADAEAIENGEVNPIEVKELIIEKEEEKMEMRNTPEYVEAYARYVKTGKDEEVRSLLTENVTGGTVAVPEFVYDIVKTAWENEGVMALVNKVAVKGNLKVNFEISSTGAVKHLEGSEAVSEETLVLGIVNLTANSIKKWVGISDEIFDMRGEAFLRYIYNELAHHIAKKCADELVAILKALPTDASTSSTPKATTITAEPAQDTIAQAIGTLSDEAANPAIIMNKLTWSAFKKAQYDGNYSADIFEGLPVVFNNSLPAYGAADANAVYMIVGDLGYGAMANFPNGIGNIEFKFDDKTLMTSDMNRVLGREYVGLGAVAVDAFCLVKKPASSI